MVSVLFSLACGALLTNVPHLPAPPARLPGQPGRIIYIPTSRPLGSTFNCQGIWLAGNVEFGPKVLTSRLGLPFVRDYLEFKGGEVPFHIDGGWSVLEEDSSEGSH